MKGNECHEWQYFVPGVEAGLIEISISFGLKADRRHVRHLLRIKLWRKRLPPGVLLMPYYSLGGALLRERAREEQIQVDDRLQTKQSTERKTMKW